MKSSVAAPGGLAHNKAGCQGRELDGLCAPGRKPVWQIRNVPFADAGKICVIANGLMRQVFAPGLGGCRLLAVFQVHWRGDVLVQSRGKKERVALRAPVRTQIGEVAHKLEGNSRAPHAKNLAAATLWAIPAFTDVFESHAALANPTSSASERGRDSKKQSGQLASCRARVRTTCPLDGPGPPGKDHYCALVRRALQSGLHGITLMEALILLVEGNQDAGWSTT